MVPRNKVGTVSLNNGPSKQIAHINNLMREGVDEDCNGLKVNFYTDGYMTKVIPVATGLICSFSGV